MSLRNYYSQRGNLTDSVFMNDPASKRSKGFGFVTFDDHYPVYKIVLQKYHTINDPSAEGRKALSRQGMQILVLVVALLTRTKKQLNQE